MNRHVELSTNARVAAMASTRDPGALLRRLQGLSKPGACAASLEQAFSELGNEFTSGRVMHFRILVAGKQKTLNRGIREQVFLIGRKAVLNALRHSGAANIEIEIEYLRRRTRVFVRDHGCGRPRDRAGVFGECRSEPRMWVRSSTSGVGEELAPK